MRGFNVAILTAATAWAGTAISGDDAFKQAINYVFSGNVEGKTPQLLSSIVDENECIISVETPGNSWVYYMKQIKPDSVVIDEHNRKISFGGDNTIVEHTFEGLPKIEKDNKNSIALRGDVVRPSSACVSDWKPGNAPHIGQNQRPAARRAFLMTAGHNAFRGSGPGQKPAFEMHWHKWVVLIAGSTGSALRAVGPPNLHITPDVGAIGHPASATGSL